MVWPKTCRKGVRNELSCLLDACSGGTYQLRRVLSLPQGHRPRPCTKATGAETRTKAASGTDRAPLEMLPKALPPSSLAGFLTPNWAKMPTHGSHPIAPGLIT